MKRLIRGLGSTTINARAGFYSTLVALLVSNPEVTLEQLFSVVNAELQTSGSNSKSVSLSTLLLANVNYMLCMSYRKKEKFTQDKF